MIKEIKYNGYSTSPSDYDCVDGDLAAAMNLAPDDEGMKVVQSAEVLFSLPEGYKLAVIHNSPQFSDGRHYILVKTVESSGHVTQTFYWVDEETIKTHDAPWSIPASFLEEGREIKSYTDDEYLDIEVMGNVVVVAGKTELHYFMWNADGYNTFSQGDLKYNVEIEWTGSMDVSPYEGIGLDNDAESCLADGNNRLVTETGSRIINNAVDSYINSKIEDEEHPEIWFKHVVFGVAALRLYDGSRIMLSDIFTLLPRNENTSITYKLASSTSTHIDEIYCDNTVYIHSHNVMARVAGINNNESIRDIVSGVDIFLTEGTYLYDTDKAYNAFDKASSIYRYFVYEKLSETKLRDKLDTLVFRLALHIGKEELGTSIALENKYSGNETISLADFNRKLFSANHLASYNGRLNLANVVVSHVNNDSDVLFTYPLFKYQHYYMPNCNGAGTGGYVTVDFSNDGTDAMLSERETVPMSGSRLDISRNAVGLPSSAATTSGEVTENGGLLPNGSVTKCTPYVNATFVVDFDTQYGTKKIFYQRKVAYPIQPMMMFPSRHATRITILFDRPLYTHTNFGNTEDYQKNYSQTTARWGRTYDLIASEVSDYAFSYNYTPIQVNNVRIERAGSLDVDNEHVYYFAITKDTGSGLEQDMSADYDGATSSYNQPNMIRLSETNNPFYFPTDKTVLVGSGVIKGIAAAAKALSQGQFGQFPLYAFTSEGVWALEVSSSGGYSARQPITRDVVLGNGNSITQMDNTVMFATDRGLMILSGSDSKCISETIDGLHPFSVGNLSRSSALSELCGEPISNMFTLLPFRQFLMDCRMLYDYVHQRVIVYNPSVDYAYVYSLSGNAWGMMPSDVGYGVNSYPDALAVNHANEVIDYSSPYQVSDDSSSEDEGEDAGVVNGMLVTRPLKLDAANVLKTVDTIIQRGYFRKGHVKTILYGSRDLFNWQLVSSSEDHYLRGFSGSPYKYFRVVLLCSLSADESVSGCTVQFTPRLTNQPR